MEHFVQPRNIGAVSRISYDHLTCINNERGTNDATYPTMQCDYLVTTGKRIAFEGQILMKQNVEKDFNSKDTKS